MIAVCVCVCVYVRGGKLLILQQNIYVKQNKLVVYIHVSRINK